ncbi:TPA: ATP-binding protein [Yersinia enterocolitica]|uniref:ATP-binding protein n=1 Tax=Yersiniaceae TaxID=1903411 RepID=UPI0009ED3A12|nr:ATP-binding protein [Serratia grimesii]ELI7994230.1 ATP-binding protein [Yersinia enterocolitica]ELW7359284.1 ATP-binding protein [Yersinia enterocolitica]ELX2285237.1 ATP-binding protein [Yersinia enterocolitica]EMA2899941.1 ATP-binding protein [Yersinia enterocolitica]EMB6584167.1 ATP-binding protein [Yersinia enterocolitica]
MIVPWLPVGFRLLDGRTLRFTLFEGEGWQIIETVERSRALIVLDSLEHRWLSTGIIEAGQFQCFEYGSQQFHLMPDVQRSALCPVNLSKSPDSKAEALAFAQAFKATRNIDASSSLHDALYVEKLCRLLPVYSSEAFITDDVVLGQWLTGGMRISIRATDQLKQALTWLSSNHLADVIGSAGFNSTASQNAFKPNNGESDEEQWGLEKPCEERSIKAAQRANNIAPFELAGRPDLSTFFNEHIIDIYRNSEQYAMMGIVFPAPVVLHGPPGCGKTYAVERLVEYLDWPCFQIDASSVASPYIHDTSKKIAEIFDKAIEQAPAVIVIDEMDAFLADRRGGSDQHRVEEVAEFLRRIPQVQNHQVLILGMTNRIDIIDPAILRRGRFDHIIKVDYASESEVQALLENLLSELPKDDDLDLVALASAMAYRPLSDVSFVVREGARLAVRSGKSRVSQEYLQAALDATTSRSDKDDSQYRIGFI